MRTAEVQWDISGMGMKELLSEATILFLGKVWCFVLSVVEAREPYPGHLLHISIRVTQGSRDGGGQTAKEGVPVMVKHQRNIEKPRVTQIVTKDQSQAVFHKPRVVEIRMKAFLSSTSVRSSRQPARLSFPSICRILEIGGQLAQCSASEAYQH